MKILHNCLYKLCKTRSFDSTKNLIFLSLCFYIHAHDIHVAYGDIYEWGWDIWVKEIKGGKNPVADPSASKMSNRVCRGYSFQTNVRWIDLAYCDRGIITCHSDYSYCMGVRLGPFRNC